MIASYLAAGFTIGVLGSFHCVGMCGPIALALPVGSAGKWKRLWYILLYNFGRAVTYTILGALFGIVGAQFFIGGYQQILSVVLGVLLLATLFFAKYLPPNSFFFNKYTSKLKQALGTLFKSEKHFYTFFFIGILNGFLPCGLVYMAIAGAIAAGTVWNSALFMAAFGLGTLPIMFAVTVLGKYISVQWRNQMRKLVPVFIGIMGVLLILRGLNLGILYLSPEMKATPTGTESCCHKDKTLKH
ncbi:MAG TPA: sulfite exporter TauE/SafE family protein [Chitinophagales bacterium]|nr:sulfite exporter TauE/SafE family protein [Chitinophagales bacterium]HNM32989.1 sulfite exporter TauE/SafE family protein [Chitinophagales bacterium]